MSSAFFNKSKNIANEFIQSIVFLDDKAYLKENTEGQEVVNDLDAYEISKIFAKEKKICAVYDPENEEDILNFKEISIKADIIILDWFIDLSESVSDGGDEEDADDIDIRGKYTLDIISSLINRDNSEKLKIVLVYTGETNLIEISQKIHDLDPNLSLDNDDLKLQTAKTTIYIRAKSNNQDGEDTRFNHLPNIKDKVLKYIELPAFLLDRFTEVTSGLLSNFALKSLSTLRNNTSKILGLYDKDLDHAFLEHKSSIPNQEDAENLILEVFKDSIGDLLYYKNVHKSITKTDITTWISTKLLNESKSIKNAEGMNVNPSRNIMRSRNFLIDLLYSKETDVEKRFIEKLVPHCSGKKQADSYYKYLKVNNIDLFINNSQNSEKGEILNKFAALTHHKNVFLPRGMKPVLSLGTVLKSNKKDKITDKDKYYICIQQKCDSVRIKDDEDRKFLFLPLTESKTGKFNFIANDGTKLQLESKSYSIRTLKFKSNKEGVVVPKKKNDKFYFEQIYKSRTDEKLEWILDLKDLHSQRIVADYAAILSRVGLDESEWLRKAGSK
ncbi:hypothetical protein J2X97_000784 [Epilithonimonas hungarica]|uniref:response regulator receiver domain n=1 Tax=Epilithonimonas hungarica TaxID=454006 RepID=UPI0027833279|nr:response regulator receiver domain [Epilithonimonas hungarica]MDP9955147.1 hypothetical protein [Epilithonimonas hungarica]